MFFREIKKKCIVNYFPIVEFKDLIPVVHQCIRYDFITLETVHVHCIWSLFIYVLLYVFMFFGEWVHIQGKPLFHFPMVDNS